MRTLKTILTILLISYISSSSQGDSCAADKNPTSFKECNALEPDPGDSYCCYVHLKDGTKYCYSATKDEYDNIDDFKSDIAENKNQEVTDLRCHSNYLKFYVLSLLLALFIF